MKKVNFSFSFRPLAQSLLAMLLVMAVTIPLWLIGRATFGEAGIALIYLLPVSWSAYRWGQLPGMSAALTASLVFNFLFIPPFFTFAIGRLEGWLVLATFLGVAIVVVREIQSAVVQAREATFKFELCSALAEARTQEAVAHILTRQIQQLYQAALVRVCYRAQDSSKTVSQPYDGSRDDEPDRILPIMNARGLAGEIQIWRGAFVELPPEENRLLQDFASQAGRAFERTLGKG